jgi:uncharacterized membrane protein YadS
MKEATGELSMTVVVIIAIIAILGILTVFLFPRMKDYINDTWGKMSGKRDEAVDKVDVNYN